MTRILVIDDEPQIRRFLRIGLSAQGYDVIEAGDGATGLRLAGAQSPDLIILDLGLPDQDGREVLGGLKVFFAGPIIILSVRDQEQEIVSLLDEGAHDYVVKPFGISELLARIRVHLREVRRGPESLTAYDDGVLRMDVPGHRVELAGQAISLTPKEFELLKLLLEHPDRVLTQRQILDRLWGRSHHADTHYLRILVGRLRAKLNDPPSEPRFIETEPGVGYRFLSRRE